MRACRCVFVASKRCPLLLAIKHRRGDAIVNVLGGSVCLMQGSGRGLGAACCWSTLHRWLHGARQQLQQQYAPRAPPAACCQRTAAQRPAAHLQLPTAAAPPWPRAAPTCRHQITGTRQDLNPGRGCLRRPWWWPWRGRASWATRRARRGCRGRGARRAPCPPPGPARSWQSPRRRLA